MWQTDKNTIRTKKVPFEQMVFFYILLCGRIVAFEQIL